jgi:uncharacterized protein YndB with AHSA1/START domain
MQTIKKTIDIQAPKEKVWHVLLDDKFSRIWYAAFSEGTYAETDWKTGSKVVFKDNSNSGLVGRVIANQPNEVLTVEYTGVLTNGVEDYESEQAKAMKGSQEKYRLTEKSGLTHLSIESDMDDEYFDSMSAAWDKALQKVQALAEDK